MPQVSLELCPRGRELFDAAPASLICQLLRCGHTSYPQEHERQDIAHFERAQVASDTVKRGGVFDSRLDERAVELLKEGIAPGRHGPGFIEPAQSQVRVKHEVQPGRRLVRNVRLVGCAQRLERPDDVAFQPEVRDTPQAKPGNITAERSALRRDPRAPA